MFPRRAVPFLLFVIGSLVASAGLADSADLRTTIHFDVAVARATRPLYYAVGVENLGPDVARNVEVSAKLNVPGPECSWRFVEPLQPHQSTAINCLILAPDADTTLTVTGMASSATPDPDLTNNTGSQSIPVLTNPDLAVQIVTPINIEPGLPFEVGLSYTNLGGGTAENTQISLLLPPNVAVKSAPPECSVVNTYATCRIGTVPLTVNYDPATSVSLQLVAPDIRGGGVLRFVADITNSRPEIEIWNNHMERTAKLFRALVVDTSADAGPGSLRQALSDANAQCSSGPCQVQFRISGAAEVPSIHLQTPLPVVTANNLLIDGTTQWRFMNRPSSTGPAVEITGSEMPEGDGLVVESACDSQIGGLVLNGFRGAAIRVQPAHPCDMTTSGQVYLRTISGNYIGTGVSGSEAVPNLRGIVVAGRGGASYVIEKNVISGNSRSALYVDSPATTVRRNVIGLDATASKALGNGASGIFISRNGTNTDISENAIAFNHEFGVAIERGARLTEIHGNSIHANWQPGIDIGLDGPTAATEDPAAPSDLSARYDPQTNTTIIEGTSIHAEGTFDPIIRLFANDAPDRSGFGQGQYYLGETRPLFSSGGHRFTFTWPGDLRGKFIAATATRVNYYGWLRVGDIQPEDSQQGFEKQTSEFSRTIEVK